MEQASKQQRTIDKKKLKLSKKFFVKRIAICSFVALVAVLGTIRSCYASQSLAITEVMYDAPGTDTDTEWIAVTNLGSTPIDLTTIKLRENNSNHSIKESRGGTVLDAGESAVIANTPSHIIELYPNYKGKILDSTFSLSNNGELLELIGPGDETLDSFNYSNFLIAGGDGNVLFRNDGVVTAKTPSLGTTQAQTSSSSNTSTTQSQTKNSNEDNESLSSSSTSTETAKRLVESDYTGSFTVPSQLYVGVPINITSQIVHHNSTKDNPATYGNFSVNYGDGTYQEFLGYKPFSHTYKRPGDYIIVLNYFASSLRKEPDIHYSKKVTVEPVPITPYVTPDGIEITSLVDKEVELSNWTIQNSNGVISKIAPDTFIAPKATYLVELPNGFIYSPDLKVDTLGGVVPIVDQKIMNIVATQNNLQHESVTTNSRTKRSKARVKKANSYSYTNNNPSIQDESILASVANADSGIEKSSTVTETTPFKRSTYPWIIAIIVASILLVGLLWGNTNNKAVSNNSKKFIIEEDED